MNGPKLLLESSHLDRLHAWLKISLKYVYYNESPSPLLAAIRAHHKPDRLKACERTVPVRLAYGRTIGSIALLATALLASACSSSTTHTTQSASTSTTGSTRTASTPCATPTPDVPASSITPRFDGFFQGHEAYNDLIVVRFYPDHSAFLAVGTPDDSLAKASTWLTKNYADTHGHLTGPWTYDATGAFSKVTPNGTVNSYSVFKYTGEHFNLHVVSSFGCTVKEETTYMTFVPDGTKN